MMKSKFTYLIGAGVSALMLSGVSLGATYSVNAGSGTTANGIADSGGTGFAGDGVVAIGVFEPDTDFSGLSATSDITSAFTQFGSSDSFLEGGALGNRGQFSLSVNDSSSDSPFAGSNIYLFVGDQSTFESSTEFLVLRSSQMFQASDDDVPTPIDAAFSDESELLFGTTDPDVRTSNIDTSETPGFRTQLIPEPSTAILGLLGFLGVMRRRR